MKKKIEALAAKFDLSVEFLTDLEAKVVDKDNFARAVKMFADGLLPFDVATGKDPINVAALRKKIAGNIRAFRADKQAKIKEAMEQQRRIVEYYNTCRPFTRHDKAKKAVSDVVFIKNHQIVAFAHFEPKQGGIYMANNEVMPEFRWNPHQALARLRKLDKAFYRKVKKATCKSPGEWFDFNLK